MSRDDRDQRARPRSGKAIACTGCDYCGHGKYKRGHRRRTRRDARREIRDQRSEG